MQTRDQDEKDLWFVCLFGGNEWKIYPKVVQSEENCGIIKSREEQ
jgi:hypothetical protein